MTRWGAVALALAVLVLATATARAHPPLVLAYHRVEAPARVTYAPTGTWRVALRAGAAYPVAWRP